jgi:hypothetical protein
MGNLVKFWVYLNKTLVGEIEFILESRKELALVRITS